MVYKLFLLEFHVGTIHFEPTFKPVPQREKVIIDIEFEDVNLNIDPEDLPLDKEQDHNDFINYNMGKSYLFTTSPQELIKTLKTGSLEISVKVNEKVIGIAKVPWKDEFCEMIELFQKIGVVKGVDYTNDVKLKSKSDGEVIGKIEIFMRLSCFGDSLETSFQAKSVGDKKEYIFKNPCDVHSFKCEMIDTGHQPGMQGILPVVNLYNPATGVQTQIHETDRVMSWTEIFGGANIGNAQSRASYSPFSAIPDLHPGGTIQLTEILQRANSGETVSICFRPDENKFFDLLNMMSTEMSHSADKTTTTYSDHNVKKLPKSVSEDSDLALANTLARSKEPPKEQPEDPLELTADKINRRLCKNKDCPAAKKFKEYGIGPLATGRGLGTLYGDVEPPVEYGLSHTYGTMSNYGPYGVYSRPKRADQPFIPPKNALETRLPPESKNKCNKCPSDDLRLRGGAPWPNQPAVLIENSAKIHSAGSPPNECFRLRGGGPCPHITPRRIAPTINKRSSMRSNEVLRLRGGGLSLDQPFATPRRIHLSNKGSHGLLRSDMIRLRGGGALEAENSVQGLKSPIRECKDVMNKFDEILVAYKKALGPCGQATCPNAPSLAQEKCKSVCGKGEGMPASAAAANDGGVLCETPCDFKGGYTAAACRDPKCAYAKYKLDLVDDDAALELQFLPPAVSGKCGHPKCPYPIQPDLPPIHWDCPDPLPKGNCKNPNCPLQPRDLRKLKLPEPKPGPCGSPDCPYALPPPCDVPTCPFKPRPMCPFLEKQKRKQEEEEQDQDDNCENPECPFANENVGPSESFDDSKMKGQFIGCSNPRCPFATKGKRRPEAKSDKLNICGNPSCPFAKVRKQNICSNPSCPFAPKPKKENKSCGDPGCPFAEKPGTNGKPKKTDVCSNPDCPFAPKSKKQSCGDPECPFAEKPSTNGKPNKTDMCYNPDCPFASLDDPCDTSKSKSKKKSDNCDNPDCPFNEENCSKDSTNCSPNSSVCENPECPYAEENEATEICDDPMCPYMQPLPSCGIPGCPYEPVPTIPCPGPRKQSFGRKSGTTREPEKSITVETEITQGRRSTAVTGVDSKMGGGDGGVNQEEAGKGKNGKNKRKRKRRSQFVYTMGNQYPGVKVGHKECVTPHFNVPPKMGWLWNIPMQMMANVKPRRGWKPGAIQRSIAATIRAHREAKGLGILRLPKFKRNKQGGMLDDSGDEAEVAPKPTLQIQKKDGAYWITMNPLKDPKTLVDNENPYMECTPMQFKITKNKKRKDNGGEDGDSKLCYCEDEEESSSSDSELDIEFTPPAGVIHPERFKKKKNIVHCEVQYDPRDFSVATPAKGKEKKGGKGGKGKGKGGKKKGKK